MFNILHELKLCIKSFSIETGRNQEQFYTVTYLSFAINFLFHFIY